MGDSGMETLIVTAASGIATTLAGAVFYLFKRLDEVRERQAEQGEQLGEFRGRQEGITSLSASVLETVHRAARMRPEELKELLPDDDDSGSRG